MYKHNFKFDMGIEVEHTITGLRAIIVGRSCYATTMNRYSVQTTELNEGKVVDHEDFDEINLKVVENGKTIPFVESPDFKFNHNDIVRDDRTGYIGQIVAMVQFDTGCNRYGTQPLKLKKGRPDTWVWLDEGSTSIYKKIKKKKEKKEERGGFQPRSLK